MPDWGAYEEASKRGILPEDKAALYEEAKRRGLVPGMTEQILTAKDNETGQTVKFKWFGDNPPNETDLAEIFAEKRKKDEWEQYKVKRPGEWEQYRVKKNIVSTEELFGEEPNAGDILWDKIDPNQVIWDQPKPSLLQSVGRGALKTAQNIGKVYPAVETGLNILTSTYGLPASGFAGLAALPFGKGAEAVEAVQKALIYQPQTQAGQELNEATAYPYRKLGEIGEKAADVTGELTGSPLVATIIGTGIQASPLLLGMKPGKGKTPTEMLEAKKQLVKEGFPVTKGTALERVTEKIPPGSWWYEKYQKRLNEMIKKSNEEFTTQKLNLPDPAFMDEYKAVADTAWKNMRDLIGKDTTIDAPNLTQWIRDNPSEMNALKVSKDKTLFSFLTRIDKESQKGGVVFADLNKINESVWGQGFGKLSPNERRVRWEVQRRLKEDIQNIQDTTGIGIKDAYDAAMEKSGVVHKAESANFIENLFSKATVLDRDKGVDIFYPEAFKNLVNKNQGRLQIMFKKEPETLQLINDYADMMLGAADDLYKYKMQKPTSFLEKMAGRSFGQVTGRAGIGFLGERLMTQNPVAGVALIVPYGFETMIAHSLASPKGWMKKLIYAEPIKGMREMARPMAAGTVLGSQRQFEEEYGFPAQ